MIRFPVGNTRKPRVKNTRDDVLRIQLALNLIMTRKAPLAPDGFCGPMTVDAIVWFQFFRARLRRPDGIIDPGGRTLSALIREVRQIKLYHAGSQVLMDRSLETKARKLAEDYYFASGVAYREPIRITLTSGIRSSTAQARAMYNKFRGGGSYGLYKDKKTAKEIYDAYRRGISHGHSQGRIISEMRTVIEIQMARGTYISHHLTNRAIDVRSRTLTSSQQRLFMIVAGRHANVALLERTPPHFHLQFPRRSKEGIMAIIGIVLLALNMPFALAQSPVSKKSKLGPGITVIVPAPEPEAMVLPAPGSKRSKTQMSKSVQRVPGIKPLKCAYRVMPGPKKSVKRVIDITLPKNHPSKLAIVAPGNVWHYMHDEEHFRQLGPAFRGFGGLQLDVAKIKAQPTPGAKWKPVFTKSGVYTFYFTDNLDTEPTNAYTLSCKVSVNLKKK